MDFDIDTWIKRYLDELISLFSSHLLFVGFREVMVGANLTSVLRLFYNLHIQ